MVLVSYLYFGNNNRKNEDTLFLLLLLSVACETPSKNLFFLLFGSIKMKLNLNFTIETYPIVGLAVFGVGTCVAKI